MEDVTIHGGLEGVGAIVIDATYNGCFITELPWLCERLDQLEREIRSGEASMPVEDEE